MFNNSMKSQMIPLRLISGAAIRAAPLQSARVAPHPDMVWIPGGTFLMGSDKHYIEESPAHRVAVDGFWMDMHPVTNAEFACIIAATDYRTAAELPPNPEDYLGARAEDLQAGSLVFVKPAGPVDMHNYANWWQFIAGADWCHPDGPDSSLGE